MLTESEIIIKAFNAVRKKGSTSTLFLEEFKDFPLEIQKYAEEKYKYHNRIKKVKPVRFIRVGIITPKELFEIFDTKTIKEEILFGVVTKINHIKYQIYRDKGLKCVNCGIEGNYFAAEATKNRKKPKIFCFHLYHKTEEGKEIMMTIDHILPKSKGGTMAISNLQPMCIVCNMMKGSRYE